MVRNAMALVALTAALCSCGAIQANKARHMIAGKSIDEVYQCLGVPQRVKDLPDGYSVAEWDYKQVSALASIPLADLAVLPLALPLSLAGSSMSLTDNGSCQAILTVHDGKVVAMRYAGDSDTLGGRDSMCAPIVRGCLRMWAGKQ